MNAPNEKEEVPLITGDVDARRDKWAEKQHRLLIEGLLRELDEANQRGIREGFGDVLEQIRAEEAAKREAAQTGEAPGTSGEGQSMLGEDEGGETLDSSHSR